ncbi:MAG: ATP-binding protein [Pseudomonadota bacterium]
MPQKRFIRAPDYLIYVLIILLMIGALLSWQAWSHTENFEHFHQQLAITSVKGAADELEVLFSELQRSMRLFADDKQALFGKIATAQEDNVLWEQLEVAVQKHFPEFFGMTLTDTTGNVLRPDFDNRVVEICQQDIYTFIELEYRQQGYIHPNPLGYHFDIMVPWGGLEAPSGVFFLSFRPAMLARILQRLQSPGHELLLLQKNTPGLIEITGQGSRDTLQREFFLDADELERIAYSFPVADSRWDLIDLPADGLFYREAARNWAYAAILFSVFVSVTLLMLHQLRRKERHRIQAEEQALRHQSDLAHVDRLNILGEMASGIAHELNQPLSAISTYCQSGLRIIDTFAERPEKLVHILKESSQQAKRAGNIIHRMRQFAAKGKVQRAAMDLNRMIGDATSFIEPELDKQRITLRLDLARDLPSVIADSIQIEQVILNLMHNAIEAMNEEGIGAGELVVSSRHAEEGQLEVMVRDTGPGLDPGTVDRLFDTFFSTKEDGMGLGLAISRSIVEAHGGQLWADSEPGAGATFYFSLPVTGIR